MHCADAIFLSPQHLALGQFFLNAHDQRAIRDDLVFGDQCPGPDKAIIVDPCAVQNHRAHANQRIVPDLTSVQHNFVTDCAIFANTQGKPDIGMHHSAFECWFHCL